MCNRVYAATLAACPFCAVGAGAAVSPGVPPAAGGFASPVGRGRGTFGNGCMLRLAVVGVVMLIGAIVGVGVYVNGFWPTVRLINVSGTPVTITVDGATKLADVDSLKGETSDAIRKFRISTGSHVIEALGPDGKVIDHEKVDIEHGGVYLFSPKHGDTCFVVSTTQYGGYGDPPEPDYLNPRSTFWPIGHSITRWLEPSPHEKEVEEGSTEYDTALREIPCGGE